MELIGQLSAFPTTNKTGSSSFFSASDNRLPALRVAPGAVEGRWNDDRPQHNGLAARACDAAGIRY
jgi:hypothetical protein